MAGFSPEKCNSMDWFLENSFELLKALVKNEFYMLFFWGYIFKGKTKLCAKCTDEVSLGYLYRKSYLLSFVSCFDLFETGSPYIAQASLEVTL